MYPRTHHNPESLALPAELTSAIEEQENRRDNVALARRTLECALEVQLRCVARGILADLLLTGRSLSDLDWWLQYLTTLEHPLMYRMMCEYPSFTTFRDCFLKDVSAGRVCRISRKSLSQVKLRILGGAAHIWEDERINALLTILGSSLRLLTVNSTVSGISGELHDLLDLEDNSPPIDSRFIFGRVAPRSVSIVGSPVFQFEREHAAAPNLSLSPGFTDGMRIVVRETILRIEIDSKDAPTADEDDLVHRIQQVRLHESGHIFDRYHGTVRLISSKQFWPKFTVPSCWGLMSDDLCRFAMTSRSLNEITKFVEQAFGFWLTEKDENKELLRGSAYNIVQRLVQEGRLQWEPNDLVRCTLFDENRPWEFI